ncbi:MAG: hypothetical protein RIQ33_1531 [Bacteroidota bacterium]|jgi:bilirubin oxidase
MRNKILLFLLMVFSLTKTIKAQSPLFIPDTLSGSNISLYLADSVTHFYSGFNTHTIGYNGNYLGPTIVLHHGHHVTLQVHNQLTDTTTTHWHGLHVAPVNDGSPHNVILHGTTWSPSFTVLDKAATYWYHPHLHMKTMQQVLKGAAGLIIVRDSEEATLNLPRTYGVDDFPLVCQWKTFDANKQIVLSDDTDNVVMINGTINGFLNVPAQMVRFRILNGSSHRFFEFAMNDNRSFKQIGGDESLLNSPVSMNKFMLGPGERAEIVVDFSGQSGNTYYLKQLGTQLPAGYPGGPPDAMGMGTLAVLDNKDFNILQFNVTASTTIPNPVTSIPTKLTNNIITSSINAGTINFLLQGSPQMSMTNFTINGVQYQPNVINFYTLQDSVMIWNITNQSMMPHPWHIHGNHFFVKSINGTTPPANLQGRKDVVVVAPNGGTASIIMKYADFFDPIYPYMYHCHINSHEDNGMMGQFIVSSRLSSGINSLVNDEDAIKIFPNPAIADWTIKGTSTETLLECKLWNDAGQIIYQKKLEVTAGSYETIIPAKHFSSGVYLLQIIGNTSIQTIKICK